MAAISNLQGRDPTTLAEVIQEINALKAAIRNGVPPLNSQGAPTDGTVDLGGPANEYNIVYARNLRLNGEFVTPGDFGGGVNQIALTPSDIPAAGFINLRGPGLIPENANQIIMNGRSATNGSGGGGGGGTGVLISRTFGSNYATAGGGGGGGISTAELDQIVIVFDPMQGGVIPPIIARVGVAGTGGAGGIPGSGGDDGREAGVTEIVIGTTTYRFVGATIARGGGSGGSGRLGSMTTPGSGTGESSVPSRTSYFPVAGGGGAGAPGASSGGSGRTSRNSGEVQTAGLAGGSGGSGQQAADVMGGNGGRGAGILAGNPNTRGVGTSGTAGSDGRDGSMAITYLTAQS